MIYLKLLKRLDKDRYEVELLARDENIEIGEEFIASKASKVKKNVKLTGTFYYVAFSILKKIYPDKSRDEIYDYYFDDFINFLKYKYLPININENGIFVPTIQYCSEEELVNAINKIIHDFSGPPYNLDLSEFNQTI